MVRYKVFLSVLAICLVLILTDEAAAQRRTALVIGNAAYEVGPLRNPVNDAIDMAMTLRQLGFEVTLLRDVDLRAMEEAIDAFSLQLRQGGVGLFYFAGHGVQVNGENYFIPVGARIDKETDVKYEAMHIGRVLDNVSDAGNDMNIIILDACRNNPFARSWRSRQRGLAVVQASRGVLIAYATAPGDVSSDGNERNGTYTKHLLRYMTAPGLSLEQMFKQVREAVVKETGGRQTPWESSSLLGSFSFAPQEIGSPPTTGGSVSPSAPLVTPQVPSGPDPEAVMWALVEKSSHPDDVTAFLKAYPNGRFAPAARLKLQQLQREQHVTIPPTGPVETPRPAREPQQSPTPKQEQQAVKSPEASTKVRKDSSPKAAQLEPEIKLHEREAVSVPTAIIRGRDWSRKVPAFRMNLKPVSNREFLEFVKSHPQWKKSQIANNLHDGDYLKHWKDDETIEPQEMDRPTRYVSHYAAEAYCKALGKRLPGVDHYFVAANASGIGQMSISYDASYKAQAFNFMGTEWTDSGWDSSSDQGKRIVYKDGTVHNRGSSPGIDKRYTGRALGFRCTE
ncbi:MAG: caspase family protein [Candidatus Tectomicrobia bacterium]|nr:caspase family protein [Candidatus Tectomicrobia bacterium]